MAIMKTGQITLAAAGGLFTVFLAATGGITGQDNGICEKVDSDHYQVVSRSSGRVLVRMQVTKQQDSNPDEIGSARVDPSLGRPSSMDMMVVDPTKAVCHVYLRDYPMAPARQTYTFSLDSQRKPL